METVTKSAYAKINLGLDVLGRRADGYHDVRLIMQTVSLADTLSCAVTGDGNIHITTNAEGLSCGEDNLIYKAIKLVQDTYSVTKGMTVHLDKQIPIAAGMAGGSADCAAALRACNDLFDLHLSEEALAKLGVQLGADVPYCLMGGTALAEGIGEKLTRLPALPECYILLAKPAAGISTKEIYEAIDTAEDLKHPDIDGIIRGLKGEQLDTVTARMGNIMEPVTIAKLPQILKLLDIIRTAGAKNAVMTGSGPTVFGIYTERALCEDGKAKVEASGLAKELYIVEPVNRL